MQMLILAGGLGTRLRPLTERVPKCMVPANGKPFLEHQLRLLASRGVRDIVLCVGYLGERVLEFFGAYGDSYLLLDYREIMTRFRRSDALAMMVVYRNEDRLERSNVVVEDGHVVAYDKTTRLPGMVFINEGLSVLRRRSLKLIPPGIPFTQEQVFQMLARRRQLLAYETPQRFYEIGSFQGLDEFRRLAEVGELA